MAVLEPDRHIPGQNVAEGHRSEAELNVRLPLENYYEQPHCHDYCDGSHDFPTTKEPTSGPRFRLSFGSRVFSAIPYR